MNKYALSTLAALALVLPAAGNATVFHVGDPNFTLTSGTPFTPSITASFFNGFGVSTTFDDTFEFTIPQNGLGSGSISTSFSSDIQNMLTITDLIINGVSYTLDSGPSGQSATIGGIPIVSGVLNTIQVKGFTVGSGVYSGTATFAATPVPEPALWAMLIAGFAAVGIALRRRPSVRVAFS